MDPEQQLPPVPVVTPPGELTEASAGAFIQRFLLGFVSGIAGTILLGIVLMLTWSIVGEALTSPAVVENEFGVVERITEAHPLFLMIMLLGVFAATLGANITIVLLSSITSDRYSQRSTALTHAFFGNMIVLLMLLPAYMAAQSIYGPSGVGAVGLAHMTVGSLIAYWVLHMVHQTRYMLVSLYGMSIGLAVFLVLLVILSKVSTIVAFLVLPLLLALLHGGNALAEILYVSFFKSYGVDALNEETQFGADYGEEDEEEDLDDI